MITLVYDQTKLPQLNSVAGTFTLDWLASQPAIMRRVMTQDPALSSPGLAFLMQTIAEYGDPAIGLPGLRTSSAYPSWRDWWKAAFHNGILVAPDWQTSFDVFSNASSPVGVFTSYATGFRCRHKCRFLLCLSQIQHIRSATPNQQPLQRCFLTSTARSWPGLKWRAPSFLLRPRTCRWPR